MTPTASWPIVSPGDIGALPWRKWRSLPQIPATETRMTASPGSSMRASGTSRTATEPTSWKTTAFTRRLPPLSSADLVDELRLHVAGETDQFLRGANVPQDRRQVAAELELALHDPLHGIELAADDVFPARVRRPHDETRLRALLGGDEPARAALPVPEIEPAPYVRGNPLVRFGLEDEGDVSLPRPRGVVVLLRGVDLGDEAREPSLARKTATPPPPPGAVRSAGAEDQDQSDQVERRVRGHGGRDVSAPVIEPRETEPREHHDRHQQERVLPRARNVVHEAEAECRHDRGERKAVA